MNMNTGKTIRLMPILIVAMLGIGTSGRADQGVAHGKHLASAAAGGLVWRVRQATRHFRDVNAAVGAGYGAFLGCVSGHQEGAMGVHFASGELVGDDQLDADRPEVIVYEPMRNGRMRLVAVEYLVLAENWNASNASPPVLEGQVFHLTGSPNRYGLPAFYALHVWAWKNNSSGMFVDWNPAVSCEEYVP
jgi:hypothetical protein